MTDGWKRFHAMPLCMFGACPLFAGGSLREADMGKLPWGLSQESTEAINALVNRYALDKVIEFDEMMRDLAPLLKDLHAHIYKRAELQFEGRPYLADELAGKIIIDLYDEHGKIWTVTRRCEGKFWYALSRKFKDYYYDILRLLKGKYADTTLSFDELREGGTEIEEVTGGLVDPEEQAVLREIAKAGIGQLKELLTPAELRVYLKVTVRRYQGYPNQDIAAELGLAESTVTSWHSRIKKKVKEELAVDLG